MFTLYGALALGLMLGTIIGFFTFGLLAIAKKGGPHLEKWEGLEGSNPSGSGPEHTRPEELGKPLLTGHDR